MRGLWRTRDGELSPEQRARLAEYRARWRAIVDSTAPADRPTAAEGVREMYRAAGLAEPRTIVWGSGPRDLLRDWQETWSKRSAGRNLRYALIDEAASRAANTVAPRFGRGARHNIWEGLRLGRPTAADLAVTEAVTTATVVPAGGIWWPLRLGRRLGSRRKPSMPSLRDGGAGQHDLGWLGAYEYLHDICGLEGETGSLSGLWKIAKSAGWVVPHERVCWLTERHDVLKVDTQGRLHDKEGPALHYPDGWQVHMWKGVRVPATLLERPDRITVRMIDREPDPVLRRCLIEIMTPQRFIESGGATRVSQDDTGVLWRKLWWGFDAWAAVEVVNGTPELDGSLKHYFLQVPPHVRSAKEAVAWTYGMTASEYGRLRLRT
jgi:hypothetical protein